MSAKVIGLGRHRLKQQLASSVAVLNAAGSSIDLDEAVTPPPPETDREFIARMLESALEFMDNNELISAAERLEWSASVIRRLEAGAARKSRAQAKTSRASVPREAVQTCAKGSNMSASHSRMARSHRGGKTRPLAKGKSDA
jgi:hypothetical protein